MKKQYLPIILAVLSLLTIFVSKFVERNSAKDVIFEMLKTAQCENDSGTITVTFESGEHFTFVFPTGTRDLNAQPQQAVYYKDRDVTIPKSILSDLESYKPVLEFARDCLLNLNISEAATRK